MLEIIPYIIVILLLLAFEMIQISCAESKIKKWILPILSFLFSLFIMLNLITFELGDQIEPKKIGLKEIFSATAWGNLLVLNIPTIIFIVTIVIILVILLNLFTGFFGFVDYLKEQKTIRIRNQEDYIVKEIKEHFKIDYNITKVIFQSGLPDGYYLEIYNERNQVNKVFEDNHEDSEIYDYFKEQKADIPQHLIYLIIELVIEFFIIKALIKKKS